SISANFLNRQALPSITGLPASGPMLPRPSTAVPLVTTATKLPRAVYSQARSGVAAISRHGSATPGEYASDRSRWVTSGLVGTTSIFPGRPPRWYSSASFFRIIRSLTLTGFRLLCRKRRDDADLDHAGPHDRIVPRRAAATEHERQRLEGQEAGQGAPDDVAEVRLAAIHRHHPRAADQLADGPAERRFEHEVIDEHRPAADDGAGGLRRHVSAEQRHHGGGDRPDDDDQHVVDHEVHQPRPQAGIRARRWFRRSEPAARVDVDAGRVVRVPRAHRPAVSGGP